MAKNGVPDICVKWFRGFLCGRQQRVKIGKSVFSSWQSVNGGVPQGTLSGPEIFLHMVSDLHTEVKDTKYVDDTTLVEVCTHGEDSQMQLALDEICQWCDKNQLYLNASKTKEMLINFSRTEPNVPLLSINGETIERVTEAKLLGVVLSSDLKWTSHVDYIHKKAVKRIHFIRQLKRSGVNTADLCRVYCSIVRPVMEFSCQTWCTSLTQEMTDLLESVQRRVCRILLPGESYNEAMESLCLEPLESRRVNMCKVLFIQMQNSKHRLHYLLPKERESKYNLRTANKYPLVKCRTNRYKNSFVPWCLFNLQ